LLAYWVVIGDVTGERGVSNGETFGQDCRSATRIEYLCETHDLGMIDSLL
jgi:hypothetical protein